MFTSGLLKPEWAPPTHRRKTIPQKSDSQITRQTKPRGFSMDLSGFCKQLNRFAVRLEQFCTKLTHVMQFPAVTYEQMFNRPVLQIIPDVFNQSQLHILSLQNIPPWSQEDDGQWKCWQDWVQQVGLGKGRNGYCRQVYVGLGVGTGVGRNGGEGRRHSLLVTAMTTHHTTQAGHIIVILVKQHIFNTEAKYHRFSYCEARTQQCVVLACCDLL